MVVEELFVGYNDVQDGFDEIYCIVAEGRQRNRGPLGCQKRDQDTGLRRPRSIPTASPARLTSGSIRRSVLTVIIARRHGLIDRQDKYRPRTEYVRIRRLAGLYHPSTMAAVGAGDGLSFWLSPLT